MGFRIRIIFLYFISIVKFLKGIKLKKVCTEFRKRMQIRKSTSKSLFYAEFQNKLLLSFFLYLYSFSKNLIKTFWR